MNLISYILSATFWGGSFFAIKYVLEGFPPVTGAFLRLSVALIFLSVVFRVFQKKVYIAPRLRRLVFVAGFFAMALPWMLLFWGETHISSALAGIINGTVPLFVLIIGTLTNREPQKFPWTKLVGLILGFLGIAIIFFPKVSLRFDVNEIYGIIAVTGMAISYAISGLLTQKIMKDHEAPDLYSNLYFQILGSTVVVGLASLIFDKPWNAHFDIKKESLMALVYLGVGSSAIAYFLLYRLIPKWGIVRATTVNYLVPPISILFQWALGGDLAKSNEILGMVVILCGVLTTNLSRKNVA
jgi:drug/metabolite transporter (DMT)-like permease